MKKGVIFFFSFFSFHFLQAQQFGGNPSSIHWKQLNTDTIRIVFPQGLETKANRIATVVHALQKNFGHTIGDSIRKINILLQSQTLLSNAYVGLAPYRSEFYLTPPQNPFTLGAVDWADNLSIHEFRHVQQYSNFNKGFSKFASFVLGEQGQALANAAAIPDWFFEGDAVYSETRLTKQGRGSLPLFMNSYQAVYAANKHYSFAQMRNGSLQQYIPNHYSLGYLLVSYGRIKFGEDIWRKITNDAARFTPFFYPFQGAVKKHTGISFEQFVKDAMKYYQSQWLSQADEKMDWITPIKTNNVINYTNPYVTADGSFIVLKSSYQEIPTFYKIGVDTREKKIAVKDISIDNYFSFNNGKIIYAAFQPDPRWGSREYNSLKVVDVESGEEKRLVSKTKYFSPDISHNGNKIIAVVVDPSVESGCLVMDMEGKLIDSVIKKDIVFSMPKFSANDESFYVAARNQSGEMALLAYRIGSKQAMQTLLPYSNRLIGFLQVQGDTLLFSMSNHNRDEMYALVLGSSVKGPYRLASYSSGIYQGLLQRDGRLIGSVFTADGYRLGSFAPKWEMVNATNELADLYVGDVFKKSDQLFLQQLPDREFSVSKYKKTFQLLNIHSYRPFYENPEYSFTLYGQNVLNTFRSEIAYTYNENEGSHQLGFNGTLGSRYLQPVFGFNQTWHRTAALNKDTLVNWNTQTAFIGLQLPINLSGGKQYRNLLLSTTVNTEQIQWTGIAEKILSNRNFNYLNVRLQFAGQIQKAVQHIYPHWAQTFLVQYKSILNKNSAHQFLTTGALYFPGLHTTHNLVVSAAFQRRDTLQQYVFTNNFPFARGYTAVDFPQMWRFGVNYHIPLVYPDWGFGGIVYFQRVRANLFYDYSRGKSLRTGIEYPFNTVGTEIFFDTKWWNQQPVTFGIRYSHLLNNEFRGSTQPNVWELILPVNLLQ